LHDGGEHHPGIASGLTVGQRRTDLSTPITRELASTLELAEAEWNTAKLSAFRASGDPQGVTFARFGEIRTMAIRALSHNPSYNRAFHVTSSDADTLPKVISWFGEQGGSYWIDVVPPLANSRILEALSASPLSVTRFSDTVFVDLARPLVPDDPSDGIELVQSEQQFREYAHVLSAAFGIPAELMDSTAESTRLEHSSPPWRLFLARADAEPASVASMYLGEHAASVSTMGTTPKHRNRGLQTALIKRCIACAIAAGATLFTSQVLPGSTSERNMIRTGCQIAYTKVFWSNVAGGFD
jgi:GNAT superfamily N-acetyltransferase